MIVINPIEGEYFYTQQITSPQVVDEFHLLKDDLAFVFTSLAADDEMKIWFPELYHKVTLLSNDINKIVEFITNKLIPVKRVYLSIRSKKDNTVIGFLGFDALLVCCDELFFYIHPTYRRKGILKQLLPNLFGQLKAQPKMLDIFADVHRENIASITLLVSFGMTLLPLPNTTSLKYRLRLRNDIEDTA